MLLVDVITYLHLVFILFLRQHVHNVVNLVSKIKTLQLFNQPLRYGH